MNVISVGKESTYGERLAVSKDGNTIFLTDLYGLVIIDATEKTKPVIISKVAMNIAIGITISIDEKYAYVCDGNSGFKIVNITDIRNPILITTMILGNAYEVSTTTDINKILVIAYSGLYVLDVSDILNPVILGIISLDEGKDAKLSKNGTIAWVADGKDGLEIYTF